jgi:hypothetical protein
MLHKPLMLSALVDSQARHVAQELRQMLKVMFEKPGQVSLAPLGSHMKGSGLSSTNTTTLHDQPTLARNLGYSTARGSPSALALQRPKCSNSIPLPG